MPRTRIKICGLCRPQDAAAAAQAGADAIGLVFAPNAARCVSLDLAREIIAALPPFVMPIGLFVDATAAAIRQTMQSVPLAAIQLHGHESPQLVADLPPTPGLKALHLSAGDAALLHQWRQSIADLRLTNLIALLLETPAAPAPGGTGLSNDWQALHALRQSGNFQSLPPLIAAGGLTPHNVTDVVRLLRPYAVDVSTGVESAHRQKSPEKIAAFIQAVRTADTL
jgi:phosphoribosylanthranilate isomerase